MKDVVDRLVRILEEEVEALELVVHRSTVLSLLLRAGEERLLVAAADDLEDASTRLRELELRRAIATAEAAAPFGSSDDLPLLDLADLAGLPDDHPLRVLGASLSRLLVEAERLLGSSELLARQGLAATRDAVARRVREGRADGPEGSAGPSGPQERGE